jgi:hypothetical protein
VDFGRKVGNLHPLVRRPVIVNTALALSSGLGRFS